MTAFVVAIQGACISHMKLGHAARNGFACSGISVLSLHPSPFTPSVY